MELEDYKKTWRHHPEELKKVSKEDIYQLMLAKSSSLVKWIFIIGLIEFLLIILFLFVETDTSEFEKIGVQKIYEWFNILSMLFILYFVVKFYINYKSISTMESTKTLMDKILKTRKTVRNYIFIGLSMVSVFIIITAFYSLKNLFPDESSTFKIIFFVIFLFVGAIVIGIVWLIYQLIYGILLKKLNVNYRELAKFEHHD